MGIDSEEPSTSSEEPDTPTGVTGGNSGAVDSGVSGRNRGIFCEFDDFAGSSVKSGDVGSTPSEDVDTAGLGGGRDVEVSLSMDIGEIISFSFSGDINCDIGEVWDVCSALAIDIDGEGGGDVLSSLSG